MANPAQKQSGGIGGRNMTTAGQQALDLGPAFDAPATTSQPGFTVRVPVPPSANALFVTFRDRGGIRRARTSEYKAWATAAGFMVKAQRPHRVLGKINVRILVPRNARRDLSNHVKAVEDLLVGLQLIDDDRHVQSLDVQWHDDGECLVEVRPASPIRAVEARPAGPAPP